MFNRAFTAATRTEPEPEPAPHKEPEGAPVVDFETEIARMAVEYEALGEARRQAEEAERQEREAWALQRRQEEAEARKNSPWRNGGKSLMDAFG